MKRTILAMIIALLAITGSVTAQSATLSTNSVAQNGNIQVTMTGLTPGQTFEVELTGVSDNGGGMWTNATKTVTADANGEATWTENIGWNKDDYATSLSYRPTGGSGHWSSLSPGNLKVT